MSLPRAPQGWNVARCRLRLPIRESTVIDGARGTDSLDPLAVLTVRGIAGGLALDEHATPKGTGGQSSSESVSSSSTRLAVKPSPVEITAKTSEWELGGTAASS